ncbi:MAG: phosphate acyltransferase PlsX [Erysipelotrichaceae bacterium]|nr:phosphate acyltransferase PlsX [Erysipelotrichaceae bacterium]
MKLAVDVMGSDKGSSVIIQGCKNFVKDYDCTLVLYGSEEDLQSLEQHKKLEKVITTQVMEMTDGALAVRRKKDSSMVRAMEDLKNHKVDGVVSCGSTGALLSAATLLLGTLPNVERPAILTVLPNVTGRGVVILDIGANAENTPEHLNCFAVLGSAYSKGVMGMSDPKAGLLNIGTEEKKGNDMHREAYRLLKQNTSVHFIGNIEGKDVLNSDVDVVVTDGFCGNIMLKTIEGGSKFMMGTLKKNLKSTTLSTIGALLSKKALGNVKKQLDPDQYGGAVIVGLNGAVVKGHGSSGEVACYNAIRQLYQVVDARVTDKVREELA